MTPQLLPCSLPCPLIFGCTSVVWRFLGQGWVPVPQLPPGTRLHQHWMDHGSGTRMLLPTAAETSRGAPRGPLWDIRPLLSGGKWAGVVQGQSCVRGDLLWMKVLWSKRSRARAAVLPGVGVSFVHITDSRTDLGPGVPGNWKWPGRFPNQADEVKKIIGDICKLPYFVKTFSRQWFF